jgi:DNA-directed RNA polymerase subunit H (RpoH/RPB5)
VEEVMFKLPKIKLPKVKMPDVVGKAKDLTKKVGDGVKSTTKGATKGIKNLNPFKK